MKRRALVLLIGALLAAPALPQPQWTRVAVPFYTPVDLLVGWHRFVTAPQARVLQERAQVLARAVDDYCHGREPLEHVRGPWRETTTAWERLSAVATGPLITRRSLRQIDFSPTRANLIERAIRTAPRGAAAMERIGTPAKGLPALEWLLWTQPAAPATPACAYAREVALDLLRETQALSEGFAALARRGRDDWPEDEVVAAVGELVNQWVGGVERLRWAQMEKPLRAGTPQTLPRHASGTTAQSWQAHWAAVAAQARAGAEVPAPGEGRVTFELYLRGRGLNDLADRWVTAVEAADRRVSAADPKTPSTALDAAQALADLKRLAEAELASALEVRLGFSDADGD
ncbi:MAG: imelysin family protein [Caldimonas sp.]|uniref:imelysin family protein n=1 Tax=Caldimonas sp. TaxID=2838790 RepID=UPI00391D4335